MRNLKIIIPTLVAALFVLMATFPNNAATVYAKSEAEKMRESAVNDRWNAFSRAQSLFPVPYLTNFPLRQALIKFTTRQDQVNHPWYTYLLTMDGTPIGFFTTQTYPISNCDFLSSTDDIRSDGNGKVVVVAPSYDGMFYGGGGSSAACQDEFFFDTVTDAMYTFGGPVIHITSDQPIQIWANAPPVQPVPIS
jgi:hypothetical protein